MIIWLGSKQLDFYGWTALSLLYLSGGTIILGEHFEFFDC